MSILILILKIVLTRGKTMNTHKVITNKSQTHNCFNYKYVNNTSLPSHYYFVLLMSYNQ